MSAATSHETNGEQRMTRARMIMNDTIESEGELPDLRDLPDGGVLWKASLVLLNFLELELEGRFAGKSVLELGSGSGHLGIELWKLGANVTCTERVAQDTLKKLSDRVDTARAAQQAEHVIRAVELEWGEDEFQRSPLSKETCDFDYIIMSELVYDQDSHDDLVATLQKVCSAKTVVYSIFCDRPFSWMFFAKLFDTDMFDTVQVPADKIDLLGMQTDAGVNVHCIKLKET